MNLFNFSGSITNLKIWISGDPHLAQSVSQIDYNSISEPMQDLEDINFNYDLALSIGDFGSEQAPPVQGDSEAGEQVSTALNSQSNRNKIYTIPGNHDAGDGEFEWFERYIDIKGDNTAFSGVNNANRPFLITYLNPSVWQDGYYITIGNLLILMIPDRNELPIQYGRGGLSVNGGYPSGAITLNTWNLIKTFILANTDKNIFVCTHQNPRNTTIGTPDDDGVNGNFHSSNTGISAGAGSIYSIYDEGIPANTDNATDEILNFFSTNPTHSVSLWMAGHTHTYVGQTYNGKSHKFTSNGVQFLNIAALTKTFVNTADIDSRSWTIEINNSNVNLKCYVHNPETSGVIKGYRGDHEFDITLNRPFEI
ncbi:MAG: metallophosphoesterase [Ignavibacteriaceae bacterium]